MNVLTIIFLTLLDIETLSCLSQHLVVLDPVHLQENTSSYYLLYGNTLAREISQEKHGLSDKVFEYISDVFEQDCHLPEPFQMSHISRSALFLTTDAMSPLQIQFYWINRSGTRVFQNRLMSNGVFNQFTTAVTCSQESYIVNVTLIERNNTFYLYNMNRYSTRTGPFSHTIRILTFNTWNMNSIAKIQSGYIRRLELILSEIERTVPDIIGLQEVRFDSRVRGDLSPNQVEHFMRKLSGYNFIFQPANFDISVDFTSSKLEEGLAILSRYPITAWNYILLPTNSSLDVHQRICLHAEIATPLLPQLHIFVTHLSLNQELRLLAVTEIVRFMSRFEGSKVLMGDMNAEPVSEEMRAVRDSGLLDAWLLFHPEPDVRTSEMTDRGEERFFGLTFDATESYLRKRIDFIYIQQSLFPNTDSVKLFGARSGIHHSISDHLGVMLKLTDSDLVNSDKWKPKEEL